MKNFYFVIFAILLLSSIFACSDGATTESDAGPGKDATSPICKSDNDCDKTAGQKCIGSVCRVPECLKDKD